MSRSLAVGFGARSGTDAGTLAEAVDAVLASAGLEFSQVAVLATLDRRAVEEGPRAFAAAAGRRLIGCPAAELAVQPVPGASPVVAAAVGTPSVAEAAALLASGPGGRLLVPKRVHSGVTVAVAGGPDRPSALSPGA